MKGKTECFGFITRLKEKMGYRKWRRFKHFLLLLPFLIHIFIFAYMPLMGWSFAFFNYKPGQVQFSEMEFVGLRYFQKFFTDWQLPRILRNTLIFSGLGLLVTPLPIFMAVLLNEMRNTKAKKLVQTITTFPNFVSWIIVFGLAQALFSSTGLLNEVLDMLGLPKSQFGLIGDGDIVWGFQAALGVWKSLGWSSIVYLAAIAGIDAELYDAGKVDGANKLQLIRHITLPGLSSTYVVLLLLNISNIINVGFEQYYAFRNSLTADKIEVLDYYIYSTGLGASQYSYSIAIGIIKSGISITLLLIVNWISRKLRGSSIV